jgi:hypothetical protein
VSARLPIEEHPVATLLDPDGNQFALTDNPHFDPAKMR